VKDLSTAELQRLSRAPYPAYAKAYVSGLNYIFMLPRKCASNSIKAALEIMTGETFDNRRDYLTRGEVVKSELMRIAVVRHPVDRLISCWRHSIWKNAARFMTDAPKMRDQMPWEEFVEIVLDTPDEASNRHFRSYSDELMLDRPPDRVLHVEDLDAEWAALSLERGWTLVPLGHYNFTNRDQPEADVTQDQLDHLALRYMADSANFDYDILNWRK
jgi:hypothetical protein